SLLTRDPLPEVKDAYNVVSREESYRGVPESYGVSESKQNATSFVVKTFHNKRREFNNNNNNFTRGSTSNVNRGPNPNLNCKNYGKIRHTIDRCFEIVGFLTSFKSNNNNIGKQIFNANVDVKVNDKQASASTSSGFTCLIWLKIILLVSLIWLCALMCLSCCGITGLVIFLFSFLSHFFSSLSLSFSFLLLHLFSVHPSDQVLSVLHQDFDISKSSTIYVCEVFYRAKQTSDPFPLSSHKSKSLGELVHLDLRGPYRVPSREGFKYFLTIMDDYSRDIWVYLIKTTDEVIDVFVSFINFVNNQFDVKRNTVRSYNGTEFVNSKMSKVFSELGIIHQIFYAHTPQQNEIAERKHRYLLNVAIFGFKSPNDDGRATPVEDGSESSFRHNGTDTTKSSLCQEENTATHFGDQSSSKGNLSQNYPGQSLSFNENNSKDGQTPGVRRSSRQTKRANLCFDNTLTSITEHYCLCDALSVYYWVDVMNNEIKALNRNNTWTECDLPPGRKPIGSKWIWKIKYKAFGKIERLLRYLKGLPGLGIQFDKVFDLKLRVFSDADWAKSSTEPWSIGSMASRHFYAIQLVANPVFHEKSKHFEINVHFVREMVAAGVNKTVKLEAASVNLVAKEKLSDVYLEIATREFLGLLIKQIISGVKYWSMGWNPPVLLFIQNKGRAKDLHNQLEFEDIRVDVIHSDLLQSEFGGKERGGCDRRSRKKAVNCPKRPETPVTEDCMRQQIRMFGCV
ncbi:ribonuclease H-like domain-containing protein, partial [Tanacetum coccineum]